jgi:hypothetical protein
MLDMTTNDLIGQDEIILTNLADILKVAQTVEKKRTTGSHDMNATSSRSHAVVELKMYRIKYGLLYTNKK